MFRMVECVSGAMGLCRRRKTERGVGDSPQVQAHYYWTSNKGYLSFEVLPAFDPLRSYYRCSVLLYMVHDCFRRFWDLHVSTSLWCKCDNVSWKLDFSFLGLVTGDLISSQSGPPEETINTPQCSIAQS